MGDLKSRVTSMSDANTTAVTHQIQVCKSFSIQNTPFSNSFDALHTKIPCQKAADAKKKHVEQGKNVEQSVLLEAAVRNMKSVQIDG